MLQTNHLLRLIFIFWGLFLSIFSFAQATDVLMLNSQPIDEERYQGVRGSPYMFKEFRTGKLISVDADAIEGLALNFNGKTGGFEIRKDNRFIELNPKWYIRVVVEGEETDEPIIFQKNFLPPLKDKFTRMVYKGKKISIVEDYVAKIETKVINNVGKNEEMKRFYDKRNYYFIKDRKPVLFRLKKKNVLALLAHRKELETYLKKEKMKLNSEEDLVKLMRYYEEQGFE